MESAYEKYMEVLSFVDRKCLFERNEKGALRSDFDK